MDVARGVTSHRVRSRANPVRIQFVFDRLSDNHAWLLSHSSGDFAFVYRQEQIASQSESSFGHGLDSEVVGKVV